MVTAVDSIQGEGLEEAVVSAQGMEGEPPPGMGENGASSQGMDVGINKGGTKPPLRL